MRWHSLARNCSAMDSVSAKQYSKNKYRQGKLRETKHRHGPSKPIAGLASKGRPELVEPKASESSSDVESSDQLDDQVKGGRGTRSDFEALLVDAERLVGTSHIRHNALMEALQRIEAPLGPLSSYASQVWSGTHAMHPAE